MRSVRTIILITVACLLALPGRAQTPLITESLSVLDLSRLKVGSTLLLKLAAPWSGEGCTLTTASIIEGRVESLTLHTRTQADSRLEASFESSQCSEQRGRPLSFKLAALIAAAPADDGLAEATPLADVPGLAIGGGTGSNSLRSVQTASSLTTYSTARPAALPAKVVGGQVVGLPKIRLDLGLGQATTIIALRQNLRLAAATRFILIARLTADHSTKAAEVASSVSKSITPSPPVPEPAPEPADEMETCDAACAVVASTDTAGTEATRPTAIVSLARMGYAPKLTREVATFDYETNVLWLDATHLLCTFDPHQLRTRAVSAQSFRTIQAVVINTTNHTVDRTLRWRVEGEGRYLWGLGGGRILVQMGRELRILDADLKPLHVLEVNRPVAWVVSSPDAQHIVVAFTEERHTPHVHDDLLNTLGREPEEDLNVMVLDPALKPLLTTQRSATQFVPVLADGGELRLKNVGRNHWKIEQYGWDQKLTEISAAKSTCRPSLGSFPGNLVFAVGCMSSGGRWYRVLRPNGHSLLKGESPSNEVGLSVEFDAAGLFAVRTVSTERSMNSGQPFHRSDLARELISVYRSRDGSSVASIATKDLTLSQLTYALSPDGHQVATVGKDSVYFFDLPASK